MASAGTGVGVARSDVVRGQLDDPGRQQPGDDNPQRRARRRSTEGPASPEGTSTSGRRRFRGTADTMPIPWAPSRTGSARESFRPSSPHSAWPSSALGCLSYTNPVTAEPVQTPGPTAEAVVPPTPSPLITLPPIGSGAPPSAAPIPADRAVTRVRIAALGIDLPVIQSAERPVRGRPRIRRSAPGRPGRGSRDLPLRARPGRDVPAASDPVADLERQQDEGDGRRGLDQRRPALPVRHHQGPASRGGDLGVRCAVRRQDRPGLAPDVGGEGHPAKAPGRGRPASQEAARSRRGATRRPTRTRRPSDGREVC